MLVIPTLNPALLTRAGEEDGFSKFEHIVVADFRKGARLLRSKPTWDERILTQTDSVGRPWRLFPTPQEVDWFFERFQAACVRHPNEVANGSLSLTIDVETTKDAPLLSQLICIGFGFLAPDEEQVINVPILSCGGFAYWTESDEARVRERIRQVLANGDICTAFHNKGFDKAVLWANDLPVLGWSWCCYVNSQTEFLTDRGWLRYDEVTAVDRLGTIRAKTGEFEFQHFTNRVDTPFSGEALVFETQKSKAVVSKNHRMLTQPVYRGSNRVGEWGFSRGEQVLSEAPDACNVRTAGVPLDDSAVVAPVVDGVVLSEDLMSLFGLWITDGHLIWSQDGIREGRVTQQQGGRAADELERLRIAFGLRRYESTKRKGTPRASIEEQFCFGAEIAQAFHAWAGRYSVDRKLPSFAYSMPTRFRMALLNGLLLGDASESGGPTTFRSMSQALADGVQAIGASLGYTTTRSRNGECEATTFWPEQTERMQACERKMYGARSYRGHITKTNFKDDRLVCFTVPNETLVTRCGRKLAFHGNTMAAHHVWDAELPHNLGFLGSIFSDGRFWKDDSKGDGGFLSIPDLTLRQYNCLRAGSRVMLADGTTESIEFLVRKKYSGKVLAADADGRVIEAQVYDWHQQRVPGQQWLSIKTEGTLRTKHGLIVTPDHKLLTQKGWTEARHLRAGDTLLSREPYLTTRERRQLLGTLLGDSSLRVSPQFRARPDDATTMYIDGGHSLGAYTKEKVRLLSHLLGASPGFIPAGGLHTAAEFFPYRSRNSHQLKQFRTQLYAADGSRVLRESVLEELGYEGLAWWIGDDGCRQRHSSGDVTKDTLCLAVCRYPEVDRERARAFFERTYGGRVYCGRDGVLRFSLAATRNVAALVGPYLPPCVRYKLPGSLDAPYALADVCPDSAQASLVRVASVTPFVPPTATKNQRLNAETRFCISTTAGNFFTSTGLVKNCRDILQTQRSQRVLHAELARLKMWPLYVEQLQAIDIMTRASIRGMLIDEERRTSPAIDDKTGRPVGLKPALELQRAEAVKALQEVSGEAAFDPAKPTSISKLLFEKLRFPVVLRSEKTGAPKVDKESLMLLELLAADPAQRAALRGIIQFRQADKFLGTFVTGLSKFIHPGTWRFHTQWKLLAVSGRFTSSPNAQNWSKIVKRMFRAAQGYKFVGVDLSQAELRYIAYLANDAALLQMYRDGINVHTVNACLLFKIQCPDPKDLNTQTEAFIRSEMSRVHGVDYSTLPVPAASNWKPIRTLAKNFVFGCLDKDTMVATLNGKKKISEVQPGDLVWAWDGEKYAYTKVKRAWCTGTKHVVRLTVRDGAKKLKTLVLTPNHNVMLRDGNYQQAGLLKKGDRLMPFRRTESNGYRELDPFNNGSRVYEHRWVLAGVEVVHHRNENRDDNRPENLEATTRRDHLRDHHERPPRSPEVAERVRQASIAMWAERREELVAKLTTARVASPKWQAGMKQGAETRKARGIKKPKTVKQCPCGGVGCAKGLCLRCYNREYRLKKNHEVVSVEYLTEPREVWDLEVEHESHNFALADAGFFVSNSNYGAEAETVYRVLRSKRDPDTNKLLFPTLLLSEIQALRVMWIKRLHPEIPAFWDSVQMQIRKRGGYFCPISGRARLFRGGYNRNEMLNIGIQMGVASWMNKALVRIQRRFDEDTGGAAQVIQQVHDAINAEVPEGYAQRSGEIMCEILNEPFQLLGHNAVLPADPALIHDYLDKV